jgi:hypothetical protein
VKAAAPVHRDVAGAVVAVDRRIDFNCNGVATDAGYAANLNNRDGVETQVMTGFDDWSNLDFRFQNTADFHGGGTPNAPSEGPQPPGWAHLDATVYPHCAVPPIPTSGAAYRVPVIVWGSAALDVADLGPVSLNGAAPLTTAVEDLDADTFPDLYTRYAVNELTALAPTATQVIVFAVRDDGVDFTTTLPITRPVSPTDSDGDGIQNACDACPMNGDPPGGTVDAAGCP